MKFGIFERKVTKEGGKITITFTGITNPVNSEKLILIDAEESKSAAEQAKELLKSFGAETHITLGHPETVLHPFPKYFVGEVVTHQALDYGSFSEYFIDTFTPVPQ